MIEIWTESAKFNTSQRFADQARIILKKGWFSNLEILWVWRHVPSKEYEQEPSTWIETLNIEKQKLLNRIETQNIENQTTTDPSSIKAMLTQKDYKFKVNKENHNWKED